MLCCDCPVPESEFSSDYAAQLLAEWDGSWEIVPSEHGHSHVLVKTADGSASEGYTLRAAVWKLAERRNRGK